MASTYEYLSLANLEKFAGIDYSAVDSTAFADANVEMHITTAEELVNGFLGTSTAVTITNAITLATKFLSVWLLNQTMENLGYGTTDMNPIVQLTWDQLIKLVKEILAGDSEVGIDSIPMSGAERYFSSNRWVR